MKPTELRAASIVEATCLRSSEEPWRKQSKSINGIAEREFMLSNGVSRHYSRTLECTSGKTRWEAAVRRQNANFKISIFKEWSILSDVYSGYRPVMKNPYLRSILGMSTELFEYYRYTKIGRTLLIFRYCTFCSIHSDRTRSTTRRTQGWSFEGRL